MGHTESGQKLRVGGHRVRDGTNPVSFINDIKVGIDSSMSIFAKDTKLCALHQDLEKIQARATYWHMLLTLKKARRKTWRVHIDHQFDNITACNAKLWPTKQTGYCTVLKEGL